MTNDLARVDVPALIVHGDDDQIVPIAATALRAHEQLRQATLQVYQRAPHGLTATHKDRFHADLLTFLRAEFNIAAPKLPADAADDSRAGRS